MKYFKPLIAKARANENLPIMMLEFALATALALVISALILQGLSGSFGDYVIMQKYVDAAVESAQGCTLVGFLGAIVCEAARRDRVK